jgi:hypothetical protein
VTYKKMGGPGNSSIFWGDNQGPVVMVWDGVLPGEESAKKIIRDEDDWIICRVQPLSRFNTCE